MFQTKLKITLALLLPFGILATGAGLLCQTVFAQRPPVINKPALPSAAPPKADPREEVVTLTHDTPVAAVAFSPDGKLVATADGTLCLWDATTGKKVQQIPELEKNAPRTVAYMTVAFSPDSKFLASSEVMKGTVAVWDTISGKQIYELSSKLKTMARPFFFPGPGRRSP